MVGCRSGAPSGAVDTRWGDDVDAAARRLGVACAPFHNGDFDECSGGPIEVFERHPKVTLVGEHGKLVGVRLKFEGEDCHHAKLQALIAKQFDVDYTPGDNASPYTVFAHGELVYFATCQLVVADSRYGKYFVDQLLRSGAAGVIDSMQVH